jgi:hypothetical protein
MNKVFLFALYFLVTISLFAQQKDHQKYDVAAFVWPSYHPDDRAKIFWPEGFGEWQTVKNNEAKFEGHQQPRFPLWGYINEADPYVAEMEINAAADYGINVFIFDWYWYDGAPFLEGHLNDGYLKARNNNEVKFYIMWANHPVNLVWDKRNAGKPNDSFIWSGKVDRDEFEVVCRRLINKYFSHPSYYKVNGKPSLMIYDLQNLVEGLGGLEETKKAFDWLRKETLQAGFAGIDLQLSMRKEGKNITGVDGDETGTQKEMLQELEFNGLTHYQFVHFVNVNRNYLEILPDVLDVWKQIDKNYQIPYYPHISIGWDNSPRFSTVRKPIITNNTPENFEKALREAKAFIDKHPEQAPLITINSWNEWTETSYLQPCTMFGYGYLEAVQRVFLSKE